MGAVADMQKPVHRLAQTSFDRQLSVLNFTWWMVATAFLMTSAFMLA